MAKYMENIILEKHQYNKNLSKGVLSSVKIFLVIVIFFSTYPLISIYIKEYGKNFSAVNISSFFGIYLKEIAIIGNHNISSPEIENIINKQIEPLKQKQQNIRMIPLYAISLQDLRRDLEESITWIKYVTIKRSLHGMLEIHITEKEAFAQFFNGDAMFLINQEGEEITQFIEDKYKNLLIFFGDQANIYAKDLMQLIEEADFSHNIRKAELVEKRRWNLHLSNGVVIRLPETQPELAIKTLQKMQEKQNINILSDTYEYIDMRIKGRIYIKPRIKQG